MFVMQVLECVSTCSVSANAPIPKQFSHTNSTAQAVRTEAEEKNTVNK